MAYDEGLAQIMRDDLCDVIGISEKKNVWRHCLYVCGSHGVRHSQGWRHVSRWQRPRGRGQAIKGAGDMMFTGRKMGGLIDVTDEAFVDDNRRALWMGMALRHAQSLPPKS